MLIRSSFYCCLVLLLLPVLVPDTFDCSMAWAQQTSTQRGKFSRDAKKRINPNSVKNYASEIIVWKVEKKIGHRLNWKRRQSIRDNAKIMNDTIDKSNAELASQLQRSFHLSQSQVSSLNSRLLKGRVFGNTEVLKRRISGLRNKALTKYESQEVDQLVGNRDRVQKQARESLARTISGIVGISYQDCLTLVQPARRAISNAPNQSAQLQLQRWKRYKNGQTK